MVGMNALQLACLAATAAYDGAHKAYEAEVAARNLRVVPGMSAADEARIEDAEDELTERLDLAGLSLARLDAELAVVAWAVEVACASAPERAAEFRSTWERAQLVPAYRRRMVGAAMSLRAP